MLLSERGRIVVGVSDRDHRDDEVESDGWRDHVDVGKCDGDDDSSSGGGVGGGG